MSATNATPPERTPRRWPLALMAAPAAVAVWSGWVGLGTMCGFGIVHPLPGIIDNFHLNTAITLPVGVEAYGAYALSTALSANVPARARTFAKRSAIGALVLGMAGQVIYHLLSAAHELHAPWPVIVLVACLPVVVLGFAATLAHLRSGTGAAVVPAAATVPGTTAATRPEDANRYRQAVPATARASTAARAPAETPPIAAVPETRSATAFRSEGDLEAEALRIVSEHRAATGERMNAKDFRKALGVKYDRSLLIRAEIKDREEALG